MSSSQIAIVRPFMRGFSEIYLQSQVLECIHLAKELVLASECASEGNGGGGSMDSGHVGNFLARATAIHPVREPLPRAIEPVTEQQALDTSIVLNPQDGAFSLAQLDRLIQMRLTLAAESSRAEQGGGFDWEAVDVAIEHASAGLPQGVLTSLREQARDINGFADEPATFRIRADVIMEDFHPRTVAPDGQTVLSVEGRRKMDVTDAVLLRMLNAETCSEPIRDHDWSSQALIDAEALHHSGPYGLAVVDAIARAFGIDEPSDPVFPEFDPRRVPLAAVIAAARIRGLDVDAIRGDQASRMPSEEDISEAKRDLEVLHQVLAEEDAAQEAAGHADSRDSAPRMRGHYL